MQILPQIEEQALADKFNLKVKYDSINPTTATAQPWEAQPSILLCPSDGASGRFYAPPSSRGGGFQAGFRFGKGNYAAYVSAEHARNMLVFPGAMVNEPQSLKKITDGTSKTLLVAEVRARDNESDPAVPGRQHWQAEVFWRSICIASVIPMLEPTRNAMNRTHPLFMAERILACRPTHRSRGETTIGFAIAPTQPKPILPGCHVRHKLTCDRRRLLAVSTLAA